MNHLRNVLLDVTLTPYLLFVDVDFIPSTKLHPKLQFHVQNHLHGKANVTLLVPAFEIFDTETQIPKDKAEMLNMLKEKKISGYK